jgi:hypothetical protein
VKFPRLCIFDGPFDLLRGVEPFDLMHDENANFTLMGSAVAP